MRISNRWLAIVFIIILTFGCKGRKVMSEENIPQTPDSAQPSESETPPSIPDSKTPPSIPELERFIFEHDEYRSDVVPRKLSPSEVAKFLLGRIEKKSELRVFVQTEKVADFYDIYEIVEKFKQFLDKTESSAEDNQRSIVITRIIALVGSKDDIEFAKQYSKHLIQRADTIAEFEDLILLQNVFGPDADSAALRQKIQAKIASLEPQKDSNNQASLQYLKFNETISNKLTRVEKAQQVKSNILTIADRKKRIEEEIKAYLTIEYGFIEYLQPWATRRIKRETWATQPAEQIKRTDNQPLKEDVIKSLRSFLEKLPKIPDLDSDEKEFAKIRSLRAIKFFGGKISAAEENSLRQHKGKQLDILSNEGFLLPAPTVEE